MNIRFVAGQGDPQIKNVPQEQDVVHCIFEMAQHFEEFDIVALGRIDMGIGN